MIFRHQGTIHPIDAKAASNQETIKDKKKAANHYNGIGTNFVYIRNRFVGFNRRWLKSP